MTPELPLRPMDLLVEIGPQSCFHWMMRNWVDFLSSQYSWLYVQGFQKEKRKKGDILYVYCIYTIGPKGL